MIGIKLRETVEIVNFVWCQCCKPLTAVQAMTDIFIWMATHSWTAKKNSLTRHWQLMLWDQGEIKIIAVKLPCLTICHRWPLLPIPNHPPPPPSRSDHLCKISNWVFPSDFYIEGSVNWNSFLHWFSWWAKAAERLHPKVASQTGKGAPENTMMHVHGSYLLWVMGSSLLSF